MDGWMKGWIDAREGEMDGSIKGFMVEIDEEDGWMGTGCLSGWMKGECM